MIRRLTGAWTEKDRGTVGGKAAGLAALARAGLPVPDSWLIPVGAEPTPEALAELATYAPRWAVRSSATVEDDETLSYAGMFRSELDVQADGLAAAIGRVRSSAADARVHAYRSHAGAQEAVVNMAVLLQPYWPPSYSGVWLGRGPDCGRLEWVTGSGERLVSGSTTPAWEEWASSGLTATSGGEPLTAGSETVGAACLAAQSALAMPADLEFAVLGCGLTWLQFRPVTTVPQPGGVDRSGPARGQDARAVRGFPAAAGVADGPALLLHDTDDPSWEPGAVLLVEHTDPDWVPLMAEASAVVTAEGGMLCHAAIVARELGVPCVTGVGLTVLKHLAAADTVRVDGETGLISAAGAQPGTKERTPKETTA